MTQLNVLDAARGERGGYKVDVTRGQRIGRVSSEWFSRPADERYLSLSELFGAVRGRAERSRTPTVESEKIRVEASREDADRLSLLLLGEEIPLAPTHWSFGQLATMIGAPSTYLRQLPAPLAAINLQYGLTSHRAELITAQVTENIFDTPTGRAKLVPQGARLMGVYDSQVAFGQSRVLLVWTRLIMPNGRSIVLERQQGADAAGYSGLEDEVDNHWAELFKAALLSTILGVGAELGSGADGGSNTDILQALRLGAANSLNQTGQQVARRNLNIQPTLTIRPGFPVRVIVNRDLILEPYRG
jgi:hypothetical protein